MLCWGYYFDQSIHYNYYCNEMVYLLLREYFTEGSLICIFLCEYFQIDWRYDKSTKTVKMKTVAYFIFAQFVWF